MTNLLNVGDNVLHLKANNIEEGYVLPSTGGMGTKWFYVFGSGMIGFAAVILITKKRFAKARNIR